MRPVIIWDVDDVLNDLMHQWFEGWWTLTHPECVVDFSELRVNPPHSVLGVSEHDYLASLDDFRATRFAGLAPRMDALAWFAEHGEQADHIALTAVPGAFAPLSAAWVVRHFGRWIRTFAFVPSPRGNMADTLPKTKLEYLRWLQRGDIMVDDRLANVDDARGLGLEGIVVPRPWNASPHASFDAAFAHLSSLVKP